MKNIKISNININVRQLGLKRTTTFADITVDEPFAYENDLFIKVSYSRDNTNAICFKDNTIIGWIIPKNVEILPVDVNMHITWELKR